MAPIDSGPCSLDPGGTPCSQCIIAGCCSQTENCLNDFSCASDMAQFQMCVQGGTPPATCKSMACAGNGNCTAWTQCVIDSGAATCV